MERLQRYARATALWNMARIRRVIRACTRLTLSEQERAALARIETIVDLLEQDTRGLRNLSIEETARLSSELHYLLAQDNVIGRENAKSANERPPV